MRPAYGSFPALFMEILIRASNLKRSKSLPALTPFSDKKTKKPRMNFDHLRGISRNYEQAISSAQNPYRL